MTGALSYHVRCGDGENPRRPRTVFGVSRSSLRRYWFLALALGVLVLAAVATFFSLQDPGPASSCEQRTWPVTPTSCAAARNTSVTQAFAVSGPWTIRIWLTTLEAVDARLHPPRQVADHPSTGRVAVWLFIYENPTGDRVLHVADASNAKPGSFIYIYNWPELGSPPVPATMPAIYSRVGVPDF